MNLKMHVIRTIQILEIKLKLKDWMITLGTCIVYEGPTVRTGN